MPKLTHAQARELIGTTMQANAMRGGKCKRVKVVDVTKKVIEGKNESCVILQDEQSGRKSTVTYANFQKNYSHVVG
jgi:hypothetical protein